MTPRQRKKADPVRTEWRQPSAHDQAKVSARRRTQEEGTAPPVRHLLLASRAVPRGRDSAERTDAELGRGRDRGRGRREARSERATATTSCSAEDMARGCRDDGARGSREARAAVRRKPPNRSPQQTAGRHEVARTTHRVPAPVRAPEPAHHPPEARSLPGSAQRPQAPAPKSKLRLEDLPPEARAQLEKLDRGLAEFDRKRFG